MDEPIPPLSLSLTNLGMELERFFQDVEHASSRAGDLSVAQHETFMHEHQRYSLWANNLGLYRTGHASLDYRFRDAPVVHEYVHRLLLGLKSSLSSIVLALPHLLSIELEFASCFAVVLRLGVEERIGTDNLPHTLTNSTTSEMVDLKSATADSDEDDDQDILDEYDDEDDFDIAARMLTETIDRLLRLSMKIRDSTTRTRFSRASKHRKIDKETGVDLVDAFHRYDKDHISNCFQESQRAKSNGQLGHLQNTWLIDRLALANVRRRQQFMYWSRHKTKRTVESKITLLDIQHGSHVVHGIPMRNAPPGSVLSKPSTATQLDSAKIDVEDNRSIISSTNSMLPVPSDYKEIDSIALLPSSLRHKPGLKEFECPYCLTICSSSYLKPLNWRKHVLRDLRPYVCTFEKCSTSSHIFDSFGEWSAHEQTHFPNQTLGNQAESQFLRTCPVCLESHSSFSSLHIHTAAHLIRFAMFALPHSTGLEDETGNDDQSIQAVLEESENESGSISSRQSKLSTPLMEPFEDFDISVEDELRAITDGAQVTHVGKQVWLSLEELYKGGSKSLRIRRLDNIDLSTTLSSAVVIIPRGVADGYKLATWLFPLDDLDDQTGILSVDLIVAEIPHPQYTRNGADLYMTVRLTSQELTSQELAHHVIDEIITIGDEVIQIFKKEEIRPGERVFPKSGMPVAGNPSERGDLQINILIDDGREPTQKDLTTTNLVKIDSDKASNISSLRKQLTYYEDTSGIANEETLRVLEDLAMTYQDVHQTEEAVMLYTRYQEKLSPMSKSSDLHVLKINLRLIYYLSELARTSKNVAHEDTTEHFMLQIASEWPENNPPGTLDLVQLLLSYADYVSATTDRDRLERSLSCYMAALHQSQKLLTPTDRTSIYISSKASRIMLELGHHDIASDMVLKTFRGVRLVINTEDLELRLLLVALSKALSERNLHEIALLPLRAIQQNSDHLSPDWLHASQAFFNILIVLDRIEEAEAEYAQFQRDLNKQIRGFNYRGNQPPRQANIVTSERKKYTYEPRNLF